MTREPAAAEEERTLDNLELKRQRFEDAGRFPVRKLVVIGIVVAVLGFGGFIGYQRWQVARQVGGAIVVADVRYPAYQIEMVSLGTADQSAEGMTIPLAELKKDYIVGAVYDRTNPMPEGYQMAAGGNILPVLAYIAPSGKLVVATSFCEPCRSTTFHLEGNILVCDVCFTRWELNTLLGIGGGCFDYPPEELTAEIRGDTVFVPAADLEAWVPRAYQDENVVDETMSTLPSQN